MNVGDQVRFQFNGVQYEGVVYWTPSNGSIHIENDTHNFRIENADRFKTENPVLVDQVDIRGGQKSEVVPAFSQADPIAAKMYLKWKNSGTDLSYPDWVASKVLND